MVLLGSLFLVCGLVCLIKTWINISNFSFGSIFQGAIRFNTYIGFAVVDSLLGSQALILSVIVVAIVIPTVNVISVLVLHYFSEEKIKMSMLNTLFSLLKNPLIFGCIVGIAMNILSFPTPQVLSITLSLIGSLLLPLGLMCIGAALVFSNFNSSSKLIILSSFFKFFVYPLIGFCACLLFGLDQLTTQVVTIMCALPTASAAYILSKKMGGDFQLMARITTAQTLMSVISLTILSSLLV